MLIIEGSFIFCIHNLSRILNEMKFTPNTSTSIHTDSYTILNHDMVFWVGLSFLNNSMIVR